MLEVKWKDFHFLIHWSMFLVSILVMLEVKWKGYYGGLELFLDSCFNPCYVGSKMESLLEKK